VVETFDTPSLILNHLSAANPVNCERRANVAPVANGYSMIQWSPTGDRIAFPSADGIAMIAPDPTRLRKLTSRKLHGFAFSRDGAQVYGIFHNISGEGAPCQRYSIDVKTGAERISIPSIVTLTGRFTFFGTVMVSPSCPAGETRPWPVAQKNDPAAASNGIGCSVEGVVVIQRPCLPWAVVLREDARSRIGPLPVVGKDTSASPFKVRGAGSSLADHTLVEVTAGGELITRRARGNGYRLAEIVGASSPSGWAGCLKVTTPASAVAGYALLYSNP
jgi:hypothetical protein